MDVTGPDALSIAPDFWARLGKQARYRKLSVLPVHTHPGSWGQPQFSPTDTAGERRLLPALERMTGFRTGAVVVGSESESFGYWDGPEKRRTTQCRDVGTAPVRRKTSKISAMFSRNVLAFGEQGQEVLSSLRVGVVGASGTGSHVCDQLIRLGVGTLVVIDPDHVEDVNLNRVVTASRWDAWRKRNKAELIARLARRTTRATNVRAIGGDVRHPEIACELFRRRCARLLHRHCQQSCGYQPDRSAATHPAMGLRNRDFHGSSKQASSLRKRQVRPPRISVSRMYGGHRRRTVAHRTDASSRACARPSPGVHPG